MGGRSSKEPTAINGHGAPNVSETQDFLHEVTSTLHTEPIQSLCVANETELFSGGVDTDVVLYSWTRHINRARFKGPAKDITKVIYSSKRRVLYAASRDRKIYSWSWPHETTEDQPTTVISEAVNVLVPEPTNLLEGHSLGVTALAHSEDYPHILCSGSRDNSVCLWDTSTCKSISFMYSPRNLVTGVEWVEGEKAVLQSSEDKTLRVWDLNSCSTVQQFRAQNNLQTCCSVSSSRQQFVAGSSGSGALGAELTLWDRRNERKPIRGLKGHTESVKDCMFMTVDGRELIVSAGSDSTVRLWDKDSGDCLHTEHLADAGPITALASPSPGLIACSSFKAGISVWTTNTSSDSLSLSIRAKYN